MKIVLDEYDSMRISDIITENWLSSSDIDNESLSKLANYEGVVLISRDILRLIDDIRYGLEKEKEKLEVIVPDSTLAGLLDTESFESFGELEYKSFAAALSGGTLDSENADEVSPEGNTDEAEASQSEKEKKDVKE